MVGDGRWAECVCVCVCDELGVSTVELNVSTNTSVLEV